MKKRTSKKVVLEQSSGKVTDNKIVTDLPDAAIGVASPDPVNRDAIRDLELVELDEIIQRLMQRRSAIARSKIEPAPDGKFVRGVRQPQLAVAIDVMTGDTLLHIRHAGLGWFSFTLSEKQVQGLVPLLMQQQAARVGNKTRPTYDG